MAHTLIDLSHVIADGTVTYKGLPAPVICDYLSRRDSRQRYAPGTAFHIGRIDMVANTGTYLDSPFHRFEDGTDISGLALEVLAGLEVLVVHALGTGDAADRAIDRSAFAGIEPAGKAVLVHTGWSAHWGTERYFEGHPYLTGDAAAHLRRSGARLVGIDSLNIDSTATGARPVHTELLGHRVPVLEHVTNLEALPDAPLRLFAVPPKIRGMGTFPVRAFCMAGF